jgi:hypothetical protein
MGFLNLNEVKDKIKTAQILIVHFDDYFAHHQSIEKICKDKVKVIRTTDIPKYSYIVK